MAAAAAAVIGYSKWRLEERIRLLQGEEVEESKVVKVEKVEEAFVETLKAACDVHRHLHP